MPPSAEEETKVWKAVAVNKDEKTIVGFDDHFIAANELKARDKFVRSLPAELDMDSVSIMVRPF